MRQKIRTKYFELYDGYCRNTPLHNRTYTRVQLLNNIRNIISVGKIRIDVNTLQQPTISGWLSKGYKVIEYRSWMFAVLLTKTRKGIVRAEIQDCCFNGDYHNDVKETQPWDESIRQNKTIIIKESQLRSIIRETIRKVSLIM